MTVVVKNLTKIYQRQRAVDNVSFSIEKGDILGFLGPNGAGKSTTMKIATTFLPPTSGQILINGMDVTRESGAVRKIIGYLPEHNPLYLDMYVLEYLDFIASIHGFRGSKRARKVKEIIGVTGLDLEYKKKIGQLSKGYRQRVGLAQAMIHDPEILILDEPTSGLDPNQIIEIRNLIKNFSQHKTVIFSTHILQEVQAICNRVVIINRGKIVADDKVEQLKEYTSPKNLILAEFETIPDLDELRKINGVESLETIENTVRILVRPGLDIRADIFRIASEKGMTLIGLNREEVSLENIFQQLTTNQKKQE